MMLTTKGRYAVMAMVDIAIRESEQPTPLSGIAESQGITVAYLEQIFAQLKAAGLVESVRGPGGGYFLAREANEVPISDIITAVDESIEMTRCNHNPEKGCMSDKSRCLTHDLWSGLGRHIYGYLNGITLADVCDNSTADKGMSC